MFELVPIEYYYHVHYNIMLFVILLTLLHNHVLEINDQANLNYTQISGALLLVFMIFYLGLRPVHSTFVDMVTYSRKYDGYLIGKQVGFNTDVAFDYFMKFCSYFITKRIFFFVCACLYVIPLYVISQKLFRNYWFYSFLVLLGSYSFFAYGVNGIRNGIATSLFLLALANRRNKTLFVVTMVVSALFHKSMLLPISAYVITLFYNKSKSFLIFWIISIPASLVLGSVTSQIVSNFGFVDDRLLGYLTQKAEGFRWDFLIYSSFPVIVGYYFVIIKEVKDKVYLQLFNIYLFCNTFWILVIRASFSNRFAYLSWFMMGLIIIYPFIKELPSKKQSGTTLGKVVLIYFGLAYFMFLKDKI